VLRNRDALTSLGKLRCRDEYTYTHCVNVSVLAMAFGDYLGLPQGELMGLGQAGLLHDLGKARIAESILNKPGRLTDEEFEAIRKHPLEGYFLVKEHQLGVKLIRGMLEHHEKYDGRGYPRGLSGEQIHPYARIIALADVFDALTSQRAYKKAMTTNQAMTLMFGMRGKDFFPSLVDSFIKSLGIYPVGSMVRLNTGEIGFVTISNPEQPLFPTVKICFDASFRSRMTVEADLSVAGPSNGGSRITIAECLDPRDFKIDPLRYISG